VTENPAAASAWIEFDEVRIDLAGRRLFVAGAELTLEPKGFEVLALLARHPGRAFSRDEILDVVWGHRHVTPGVLNRAVTMIRQALGENAQQPRYLHTLHGVGYRFDTPVRASATQPASLPAEPAKAASAAPQQLAATDPAPRSTSTRTESASTDAIRAPVNRRIVVFAALALVAFVGATMLYRYVTTPRQPATSGPLLIVLPVRAVGDSQNENVLAAGISEELITRLARIDGLHVIGRTTAERAVADKLDAAQLAQQVGVTHVLEGSLREAGQKLRIDLRLIGAPSGRALWAQDYDREMSDVLALDRDVALAVAATLSLKVGLAPANPSQVDPALFRRYLELRSTFRATDPKRACDEALPALRSFAAEHPDYAPVHGLLARALGWNLCFDPPHRADMVRDATREAQRALELDPNSDDAHAALGIMACQRFDWTACVGETRAALALAPTDAQTRVQYTYVLAFLGYREQALQQAETAWYSDPLNYWVNFSRARILDTLGRHDEAQHYFDTMSALDPAAAQRMSYGRCYNAIWRHDLYAARNAAAQIPEGSGYRASHQALIEALADPSRWPSADASIAASEAATGRYNLVRLFAPHIDAPAALAAFEDHQRRAISTYSLALWQPEYAQLRRDPAFQDYLRRTHTLDYWRAAGWPPQCKPDGDGANCS
jgi:TolB-like protein/DNA-binding winged helix-turn-helix (wHTH) protein